MKLISWNVNGLRACAGKGFMDFFKNACADIFCIQETKMQRVQSAFDFSGYNEYWNDATKKGYSGALTLTREEPVSVSYSIGNPTYEDAPGHDAEGRFVIAEYKDFILINVYVPNSQRGLPRLSYRLQWQDDFTRYLVGLKKPAIICGDLNVAHTEIDIKHPGPNKFNAGFTNEERGKMTELLSKGYIDTFRYIHPDTKDAYTWWSYMANARANNVGWRIDYFLVSDTLKNRITDALIFSNVYGSDHCPVGLTIDIK